MTNVERRSDRVPKRINQFKQDGKALDYLQNIGKINLLFIILTNSNNRNQ